MKSIRATAFALLLFLPAVAHAQINLAWNNCITQATAAANKQYACDGSQNGTPFRIVQSFISPTNLGNFVAIEATMFISLTGSAMPVPDWWKLSVGECRDGNLGFPASLTGIGTGTTGVCRNPWAGANTGGGYAYESSYPPQPNVARFRTAFARDTETSLIAGQQYVGGVITLDTFNDVDTGAGVCSGCCQSVTIVLDVVRLYQTVGSPGGDIITLTTPGTRNFVTWNATSQCPVPTRRATWGSIKTTYR
jgi:hypothetical protein